MKVFVRSALIHFVVVLSVTVLSLEPFGLQFWASCLIGLTATVGISFKMMNQGDLRKRNFFAGVALAALIFTFVYLVFDWVAGSVPGTPLDLSSFFSYLRSPISLTGVLVLLAPILLMIGASLIGCFISRFARRSNRKQRMEG